MKNHETLLLETALDKETEIGVSFDDMNDFMDWVGVQL